MARGTTHLDRAIALYDPDRHRGHALVYNIDPGVISLSRASWALWALGYADQAVTRSDECLGLARRQGHPHSLGTALCFAGMLHQFRREPRIVAELAEAVVSLATEHGLQQWIVTGTFLHGWAMTGLGQRDAGIARMREAYADYRALGLALNRSWWGEALAEAEAAAGRPETGLATLTESAGPSAEAAFVGFYGSEVLRRRGLLLLAWQPGPKHVAEAEACFQSAVALARRQGGKSFELLAATSLARLLGDLGRREEARAALADIHGWFTEGFDTADLIDARVLLDSLASPGA